MRATNVSIPELEKALTKVNRLYYSGNIQFNHIVPAGRGVDFTLRVKSSRGPGARRSHTGRRMAKACWHAHGHFFDAVLNVQPNAVIVSRGGPGARVDCNGGNWKDCNIGSQVSPLHFSEACDCHPSNKTAYTPKH